MSAMPLCKTKFRENLPVRITPRLKLTKKSPYYDQEIEELTDALAHLQVDPQARFKHEAMLARLTPLPHSPESMDGIPYYDEEFDMSQSPAHTNTMHLVLELIDQVASRAGLQHLSDNPVWYMDKEGNRKTLYPDYALTASKNLKGITANELLLSLEVVSTERIDKEKKDAERMCKYNAWNHVLEFILIYPEPNDNRSVIWHQYHEETGSYRELNLPEDRRYRSVAIPGLEIEVLESSEWKNERKFRVYYQGKEVLKAEQERLAREAAERQVVQALLAKEIAERQAEQERLARDQERLAKETAEMRVEQLIALLKQSGISVE